MADKSGMLARFLLCSLLCAVAFAQDANTPPPAAKPFQFTAAVDAFYSLNLNHAASGVNQIRNFDTNDGLGLDFASFSVQANGARVGFRLDTGVGEMSKTMNLADSWAGPNRYISQAYVSYKPIRGIPASLEVDAGFTSAGAEGPESYHNFNYSRSLLYVLGEPYYHLGLRSTIPVTKTFSLGAQFLDGCNNVGDLHGGKVLGLVANVTRAKWSWAHTYLFGPERIGVSGGFRHFHDSVLTYSPRPWMSSYFEALHSTERWVRGGGASWYGWAGAARFSPFKKWSFSLRLDWLADSSGFNTGLAQQLKEVTVTAEYRPVSYLITRAEYRPGVVQPAILRSGSDARSEQRPENILSGLDLCRAAGAITRLYRRTAAELKAINSPAMRSSGRT